MEPQVLLVCGIAFVAVFVLLAILSIAMSVITAVFAAPKADAVSSARAAAPPPTALAPAADDQAVIAAITSTVINLYPNVRVSRIEELK